MGERNCRITIWVFLYTYLKNIPNIGWQTVVSVNIDSSE